MIVTKTAKEELKRMLEAREMPTGKYFRLATPPVWTLEGDFGIVLDEDRAGDLQVEHEGTVVLLVDPDLARQLMDGTFDFVSSPQGMGFKLDVRQV